MSKIYSRFSKKSFLIISFIFLFITPYIFSQESGTIRGKVTDKNTGDVLIGANALVKGTSLGAASDIDGKYIIRNIPAGSYSLTVSYIGYNSVTVEVTVLANRVLEQNFNLKPKTLEGKTVTVTAQAEGQLSAINQQLSSNTIENVVSKARIRELPDVNAAESIGRLPGVSIERSGGEATKVEIRGLNPKYSRITVNGVELPATSTSDRSVDLSLISSNMLDGISLKKTVTPDMNANVLGGTVDLKLKEAPKNLQVNLSAQGGYNQLQKYYGNYNFTGSISNRFLDNKLGVIANFNTDNYDRSADKFQDIWNTWTATTIVTGQLLLREGKVNRKRLGGSLLLDYDIPNGKITANAFFNQLKSDAVSNINRIYTPSASYSRNRHYYQLGQNNTTTNIFTSAIAVNQDYNWIRFDANISRTGSYYDEPNRRVWQFAQESGEGAVNADLYYPTMPPQGIAHSLNIDTNNTYLAYLYQYGTRLVENTTAAKFNIQVPFRLSDQFSGYFKTGGKLRWTDRSNDQSQYGNGGLQYGGGGGALNVPLSYINSQYPEWKIDSIYKQDGGVTIAPFISNYSRSNFLNGDYPLGLTLNQTRMNQMTDALKYAPDSLHVWLPYSIGNFGSDYKGFERYEAAYLMGEFNIGNYLDLIAGARWEQEYTAYDGQRYQQVQSGQAPEQLPAGFTKLNKQRKNSFWLPMVSLNIKPNDWLQIRLLRTETLARPGFIEYAPISYVTADNSTVQAANFGLKPSRATNYDAAISVFNNEIGLFSVNGFYKNIKDLIFYSTFKLVKGVHIDPSLEIPADWYSSASPTVNTYRNNPDPAKYYGFEIEWQTHFWYLPSIFQGLVLNINYTHIYSEMELAYDSLARSVTNDIPPRISYELLSRKVKTRMPDQPAHIFNLTIGYDLGGFSARLSYLYQTDKLTSIGYHGTVPDPTLSTYTGAYGRWDLTLQQKIGKHLQVFANFNNLNNRLDRNFVGSNLNNPSYIEYYGFTMDIGVRYNL